MKKEKKFWYCPTCKEYPDKIKEIYSKVIEEREWNGEEYELTESDFDNAFERAECSKCGTELKER